MSHDTPVTRSDFFDVVFQVDEAERLHSRNTQRSQHTAQDPSVDDTTGTDAGGPAVEAS